MLRGLALHSYPIMLPWLICLIVPWGSNSFPFSSLSHHHLCPKLHVENFNLQSGNFHLTTKPIYKLTYILAFYYSKDHSLHELHLTQIFLTGTPLSPAPLLGYFRPVIQTLTSLNGTHTHDTHLLPDSCPFLCFPSFLPFSESC